MKKIIDGESCENTVKKAWNSPKLIVMSIQNDTEAGAGNGADGGSSGWNQS